MSSSLPYREKVDESRPSNHQKDQLNTSSNSLQNTSTDSNSPIDSVNSDIARLIAENAENISGRSLFQVAVHSVHILSKNDFYIEK